MLTAIRIFFTCAGVLRSGRLQVVFMKHLVITFTLLLFVALAAAAISCGGGETAPTATATATPAGTVTPAAATASPATATPVPTQTGAPVSTSTPSQIIYVRKISEATLAEYARQFVRDYEMALAASAYQSSDNKTIFLPFSAHWSASSAEVKQLAEQYIRLVKAGVDIPPGVDIGAGSYKYVTEVTYQGGQLAMQGTKCAECTKLSWN